MKASIILVAVLALSSGARAYPGQQEVNVLDRNLNSHLQDFLDLIDEQRMVEILFAYLSDPEIVEILTFLFDPQFAALYLLVVRQPEFIAIADVLRKGGVPVDAWGAWLRDFLGIGTIYNRSSVVKSGGLQGLIDELISALPLDEIRTLFYEKIATEEDFREFYILLRSPETVQAIQRLRENTTYQFMVNELQKRGVDTDRVLEVILIIFGLDIDF